jgi:uncharacterized protein (TIGR02145 family)
MGLFDFFKNKRQKEVVPASPKSIINEQQHYEYDIIKIGNQEWMTKNLDVQHFQNGDIISEAKTNDEWAQAMAEGKPAWCYYKNNLNKGKKYGKLYNWYAIADPKGLAPKGWHVPSDAEWTQLSEFLGQTKLGIGEVQIGIAGTKMKSKDGWRKSSKGQNESGFSGLPGGYRNLNCYFKYLGSSCLWWSSTEKDSSQAWCRQLDYFYSILVKISNYKHIGCYVRCIKD